ncbi:hypothetical protein DXG01_002593 [Tephrocybe rancida]|nr:hypothetical protein DXG01_002593 [Tephrocybe rancida]
MESSGKPHPPSNGPFTSLFGDFLLANSTDLHDTGINIGIHQLFDSPEIPPELKQPGATGQQTANTVDGMVNPGIGPQSSVDIDELLELPKLEDLKIASEFIQSQQFSLELFISMQNAPQEVYTSTCNTIPHRHPDNNILSLDAIKQLVSDISEVMPIT